MSSLRNRTGLGYVVIVAVSIVTSFVAVYNFQSLRATVQDIYRNRYRGLVASENMLRTMQQQESAQLSMLTQDIDLARMMIRENRDQFLYWADRATHIMTEWKERRALDTLMGTYRNYLALSDSMMDMIVERRPAALVRDFQFFVLRPTTERLKEQCFAILDLNQAALVSANQKAEETATTSAAAIVLASAINIILSIVAGAYITRRIVRPVTRMTRTVREVSQGNLNRKLDIETDDEIGALSREFNIMTERLLAYERLNVRKLISEKTKSEAIVSSISDPIIVTDERGTVIMINAAARAILPDPAQHAWEGRAAADLLPDAQWAQLFRGGGDEESVAHQELIIALTVSGQTLFFRPRQRRIVDEQERQIGNVTMLQDVTRFKRLDQMKSDFLAAVSHEFRTPLTSISMTVDILLRRMIGDLNARQEDLLLGAKQEGERLRKLVEELLSLAKLEAVAAPEHRAPVDVGKVIRDALRPLLLPMTEKSITLDLSVADRLPDLEGDDQQLGWVVMNLVSNAVRHTPEQGRITVSAVQEGAFVVVTVSDTGHGIAEEELDTIFDKFVQIKHPDVTTPGSVGLGLAISRSVVEAHGGTIRAVSTVGKGSTFTFTLPVPDA